jgi:transcriptional regulator with XRE-family HTH domain
VINSVRCKKFYVRNTSDIKQSSKSSQEENLTFVKKDDDSPFGQRLREVFHGAKNREIAKILSISDAAVSNFMKSKRIPDGETIAKIWSSTNVNLDWLVFGQGATGEILKPSVIQSPELSQAEQLLKENSLPDVFTQLLERLDTLETRLAAVENQRPSDRGEPQADELLNNAAQSHRQSGTRLIVPPLKKGLENIFDFVEMVQRDYPEITELEILDIRAGRTEGIDPQLIEIVQGYIEKADEPKNGTSSSK